jgi:radical SAM superfamily enzyme YgiQ (UPF0313 family)
MMKVVLVALDAKYIHSNLAIRYLESYYNYHYYDDVPVNIVKREFTINQQISDIVASLYEDKADLIGFSCYIWNIEMVIKVVRNFKKIAPNVKIVLGGPEVSYDSTNYLNEYPEIDYIICGEGEQAFADLVRVLCDKKSKESQELSLPRSIGYRNQLIGGIEAAVTEGRIEDLQDIPSPYSDFDSQLFQHRIIYYEASRGCPYSCQYCLSSADRGVRFFPIERVKKDLLTFIQAEVKQVKFVDRTFNCAPKYALEVFKWIIKHNRGKTNFHFEISADLLSDDMISFLNQAPHGLFQFEIGVQSTNEQTLSAIQRKTNLKQLKNNVLRLQLGSNIHQHLDLIVGLPHEDYLSFAESFNEVYELRPDKLQMGFLKVLKGSGMHRRANEYGFIYTAEAPYEIMQNNDLSYDEVIKLKGIEHVLDHYYNSHQFDQSILYLTHRLSLSPFMFYEQLAAFCKERGFFKRAHSQASMYQNLFDFASYMFERQYETTSALNDIPVARRNILIVESKLIIREIMKFDFIRLSPHGKLPSFMEAYYQDDFKIRKQNFMSDIANIERYFPQYADINMRNLSKRVHLECFKVDVMGSQQVGEYVYLFVYHDDPLQFKRADCYDVTSVFMNKNS